MGGGSGKTFPFSCFKVCWSFRLIICLSILKISIYFHDIYEKKAPDYTTKLTLTLPYCYQNQNMQQPTSNRKGFCFPSIKTRGYLQCTLFRRSAEGKKSDKKSVPILSQMGKMLTNTIHPCFCSILPHHIHSFIYSFNNYLLSTYYGQTLCWVLRIQQRTRQDFFPHEFFQLAQRST